MKFLATDLKLSIQYTNHSIRATCISTLDSARFEARHIMALSSHKNECTIKEYSTTCPEIKRKEMFDSLSDAIKPKSPKIPKIKASATVTKQDDIPTPNPNFDINFDLPKDLVDIADSTLQEIDDFNTIDDEALAHLMSDYDNKNTNNNNPNKTDTTNVTLAVTNSKTQVNNINQNTPQTNIQRTPKMPFMFFPNSNVTINYNFGK